MSTVNYFHMWILFQTALATAPIELLFLINNEENEYHQELSRSLQSDLIQQSERLLSTEYQIRVHIIHDLLNSNGNSHNRKTNNNNNNRNKKNKMNVDGDERKYVPNAWTILYIIPQLFDRTFHYNNNNNNVGHMKGIINNNTKWIIICDCTTFINVTKLVKCLYNENYKQPLYLGYPLYDREPTIIHHFAYFENPMWFPYPMLTAGIIFSAPLFKGLFDTLMAQQRQYQKQQQQQQQQQQQRYHYHYHYNHNNNNNNNNNNSIGNSSYNKNAMKRISINSEFSIDAAHELAHFIYHNVQILEAISIRKAKEIPNNSFRGNITKTIAMKGKIKYRDRKTGKKGLMKPKVLLNKHVKSAFKANEINITAYINKDEQEHENTAAGKDDVDYKVNHNDNDNDNVNDNGHGNGNGNDNANNENLMRWEKIIMRKVSYICPKINDDDDDHDDATIKNLKEKCAMYARPNSGGINCKNVIKREQIYFAVKTCHKYHNDRLPIIQSTWAQYAKYIKYFSDRNDDVIPTINVGIPNVEIGHCAKTLKIIQLALKDIEEIHRRERQKLTAKESRNTINWIVLTDDDTLLSVSGICQILGCHDPTAYIYLGERYGYRLHALDGFNYITGGGGIIFSLPTLRLILRHCTCPSSTAPDDMILGSCLHTLQVIAKHSMRFHQARPQDYPMELLHLEMPISFHKFWQLDPIEVYNEWFATADREMLANEHNIQNHHQRFSAPAKAKSQISINAKQQRKMDQRQQQQQRRPQTSSLLMNNINVPVNVVAASAALHHTNKRHIDL